MISGRLPSNHILRNKQNRKSYTFTSQFFEIFMQPVKNIIFDLGGVLLNLDFAAAEKAFTDIGFEDFKDVFGGGHVTSFIKDYEVGTIDDDQFVKEIRNL